MAKKKPIIFFDLDGTLIDVSKRHYEVYGKLIKEFKGEPLPKSLYWKLKRSRASVPKILRKSSVSEKLHYSFLTKFISHIERKENLMLDSVFPYTKGVLKSLRKNYRLYLTTQRRSKKNTIVQLKGLGLQKFFEGIIISANENRLSKVIKNVSREVKNSIIIGDTEVQILIARKVHLFSVAVLSGIRNKSTLKKYKPDFIEANINYLPDLLKKINNLDQYNYSVSRGFTAEITTNPTYTLLSKYFRGTSCLELGCADGAGTKILLNHFSKVVAVDGSLKMIRKIKKWIRSKKLRVVHSYFENLSLPSKFDTVVMCHVLEHVDNPVIVLKNVKRFVKKNGRIIINVPNAFSLHRQAGVLLGMLKDEHDLNESDLSVGHKRVYDINKLKEDIKNAGLKTIKTGGFLLKAFSNSQLKEVFKKNPKNIDAYIKLGEKYPEIAAEIYTICKI